MEWTGVGGALLSRDWRRKSGTAAVVRLEFEADAGCDRFKIPVGAALGLSAFEMLLSFFLVVAFGAAVLGGSS